MTKLVDLLDQLKYRRTFGYMDDFDYFVAGERWASSETGTGSMTVGAEPNGLLMIEPSAGAAAANDAMYLSGTGFVFQFQANQPIVFEALVQFTEANANQANVLVGFSDTSSPTTSLLENNGGPATSYTGMTFFKQGGTNLWGCQTSVGSSQLTTVTSTPAGGDPQTLTAQFEPISATQAEARFFIDGLLVVKQVFSFASAPVMRPLLGIQNGSANGEQLNVDYVAAYQLR
ncbi:MAG TPA: hypothetical protein VHX65_19020 [Pirellulales bacterium]|jgi:hypothetical protein|nr:hypothetical protein [Pirellulales bacterium]